MNNKMDVYCLGNVTIIFVEA